MAATTAPRSRLHLFIAGAAILWNLIGTLAFVQQVTMGPEQVAALSAADRAVHEAAPTWVRMGFGLAVGSGVAGSIWLLLRRRWAVTAFTVSLAALLVQIVGAYATTPAWEMLGASGLVVPILLVVIQALLLRYSRRTTT